MKFYFCFLMTLAMLLRHGSNVRHYDRHHLKLLRSEVKEMFEHAYHGYMKYAYPYDELRPLTCDGVDTWGSYSLSLIDALDTLVVMGLHEEFNKAVEYIKHNVSFDADINVSVFETNIRVVGGLLSAHMLSHRATTDLEMGWPCNGPLLRMAEDVARRLLPAFNTPTGMPYGTVNLRSGVPDGETTVTCTAGVGTFILEFGTLSRLTGDSVFEQVALKALHSLFNHRSKIGLMGNHLDVASGQWIAHDSGIGGGIDSYFEYLVKGSLLFNLPHLRSMFDELRKPIDKYSATSTGWYFWVNMQKGQVTMPIYQSLESYWPGLLSLIGDIDNAMKSMSNYHNVLKIYGFIPEVYNIVNQEAARDSFPLRPELVESAMYLYKATNGDPYILDIGSDILRSIQHSSRTRCGYATIKSCKKHTLQNRMESFFLAETTKYLYLLFDPDNFIHNDGRQGKIWHTAGGRECVIDGGGYIFNTEAHPIDPGVLYCCYTPSNSDWSHVQRPKYQHFVKSSIAADRKRQLSNRRTTSSVKAVKNFHSMSGHRFIMDETTMYWTQQSATDDQRPQFKNDHRKPSTTNGPSTFQPALSLPPIPPPLSLSLSPPPPSLSLSLPPPSLSLPLPPPSLSLPPPPPSLSPPPLLSSPSPPSPLLPQSPPLSSLSQSPPLQSLPQPPPLQSLPQPPPLHSLPQPPPLQSLPQPPPLQSLPLLSIYQIDDQHDQRPDDCEKQQFVPTRLNTAGEAMPVSGAVDPDHDLGQQKGQAYKDDDGDSMERLSATDRSTRHDNDFDRWPTKIRFRETNTDNDENDIWGTSARRRTEDGDDEDQDNEDSEAAIDDQNDGVEYDSGYNLLTCRSTNNFYINIHW